MIILRQILAACLLIAWIRADIYLHYPRGSNNRLREKTANRENGNRVFDSQNNNKGGYNVGILNTNQNGNKADTEDGDKEKEQNQELFMASSPSTGKTFIPIRWTNQHGSGGDEDTNPTKLNSNFVIQMMCQDKQAGDETTETDENTNRMRNGVSQQRQDYENPQSRNERIPNTNTYYRKFTEGETNFKARRRNRVKNDRVLQEPMEWYDKCYAKQREKGLFTADQNVNDDKGATRTRQNPNGDRRGYECPEERDYFPYWAPTPWLDMMVYAKNESMCSYYKAESFNVKSKMECVENWPGTNTPRHYSSFNNKEECETMGNGGQWLEFHQYTDILEGLNKAQCEAKGAGFHWARPINLSGDISPKCLAKPAAPDCKPFPFGRVNHLGNGVGLEEIGYDMPLPYFPSGKEKTCVLRTRYNISTDDYDGWNIDSTSNKDPSIILNNPDAEFGAQITLDLAINTAQFGRTFQDRTHTFTVVPRPSKEMDKANIKVLSVQGKRGNIVQTYPAVEYDFVPREMKVSKDDLVHVLWTGSNTHNNQDPAGDGQAGDDGQGRGGTDRSNILGLMDRRDNWPLPDNHPENLFNNMKVVWSAYNPEKPPSTEDLSIQLASSGYFKSMDAVDNSMQDELDNAPPTFIGAMFKMTKTGKFHYMCSRNNNFSNRSQKGSIIVQ